MSEDRIKVDGEYNKTQWPGDFTLAPGSTVNDAKRNEQTDIPTITSAGHRRKPRAKDTGRLASEF